MTKIKKETGVSEIPITKNGKPRKIDVNTQLLLFSKSAGRCEICNKQLTKDIRTGVDVIWGEKAHIYAFNEGGARAQKDKTYLNTLDNLLLACPDCHEKIDKKPLESFYSTEVLQQMKAKHEKRIEIGTEVGEERKTKVLKMIASINEEKITADKNSIFDALIKERLISADSNYCEIDFSSTSGQNTGTYWDQKAAEIDEKLKIFSQEVLRDKIEYISVFAIGPIPLLMHLGSKLENKVKTIVFQRHRGGEHWRWEKEEPNSKYSLKEIQKGKDNTKVALLISISGFVDKAELPKEIDENYFIYEIFFDPNPNYNCLEAKEDVFEFEKAFVSAISTIKNNHSGLTHIDFFPATPAPIAIVCGRSLNKNADPKARIYNLVRGKPFEYSLTIN